MNDTHVSSVSLKTALSTQAYILFYVRSDLQAINANISLCEQVKKLNNSIESGIVSSSDSLKLKSEKLKEKWALEKSTSKSIDHHSLISSQLLDGGDMHQSPVLSSANGVSETKSSMLTQEDSSASSDDEGTETEGPAKTCENDQCRLISRSSWMLTPFRYIILIYIYIVVQINYND